MKTYVLYHGNCYDGFGAAYAAWLRFRDDAEYIPVNYGHPPPPMEQDADIFIIDFSYPRDVLIALYEGPGLGSVTVLDHHATAEKDLAGLPFCKFDMNKSGAVLAWEHFHPNITVPEFFMYLQDRDLWTFTLPKSREVSMALRSYPMDFKTWDELTGLSTGVYEIPGILIDQLKKDGAACRRLTEQQVDIMARNHRMAWFSLVNKQIAFGPNLTAHEEEQYVVAPVANASVFFSEVGERMLELRPDAKFSAYYFDRADGVRQWGLRSRPDFDCSVIAKAFGGGGHKQAAGFQQKTP